jgi:hypothetical protein
MIHEYTNAVMRVFANKSWMAILSLLEDWMSPLVEDATGNKLTFRIIGAAMTVHNQIGPGYKEEV